jgi:hypothetical protein
MDPTRLPVSHWIAVCDRHIETYIGNIENVERRSEYATPGLGVAGFREGMRAWQRTKEALALLPENSMLSFVEAILVSSIMPPPMTDTGRPRSVDRRA